MNIKHATRLGLVALAAAWSFDFLFWKKAPGVSFFVFVLICLAAGGLLTFWEKLRPASNSLWLLLPAGFFAAMTFVRNEPFTLLVDVGLTLAAMGVLALTWLGGRWLGYSLSDYVVGALRLAGSALSKPVLLYFGRSKGEKKLQEADAGEAAGPEPAPARPSAASRQVVPVLRGILLAIPVLAIMAALLAAADPIFSQRLNAFLQIFRIDKIGEYIFRAIYIAILAYLLIGVYLHALASSQEEKLIGVEKAWVPTFLGWTEAAVVLGSVDLLFAFFVGIQFRYFFGGQANIHLEGYTYAEYARRGFGELLGVAVISLLLFLSLSAITRREKLFQRRVFSGLGIGLVVLVAVILVSAFQRLLLYEAAYGFTRVRTYTHVFMIWVGVLLLATVVLELVGRQRSFGLALALVAIGFGVTLSLLNVDGFIVRQNLARAENGGELDAQYLNSLSYDAVPALAGDFNSGRLPASLNDQVGGVLACWTADSRLSQARPWQSFQLGQYWAGVFLDAHKAELAAYPLRRVDGQWRVEVGGVERACFEG